MQVINMATREEKIAKQKDDGRMALLGMKLYLAMRFNVDISSKAVDYIVGTFLECIDEINFQEYMMGKNKTEKTIQKPLIIKNENLKKEFKGLMNYYDSDIEEVVDIVARVYDVEFFIDEKSNCIYCTEYSTDYLNKTDINMVEVRRVYNILTGMGVLKRNDLKYIEDELNKNDVYLGIDIDEIGARNSYIDRLEQIFGFYK